jgi:uncharacterized damage-inducible protein DinB
LTAKQQFLTTLDEEHARTMRVLRAMPADQAKAKLHANVKTAQELAWTFVMERYLGRKVWDDDFAQGMAAGMSKSQPPKAPESFGEVVDALEKANADWRKLIESASEADLQKVVSFMVGPKQMGQVTRMNWAWFLLHDEIHHRGQFTILLRLAGAKVPSVYGPSESEPWV